MPPNQLMPGDRRKSDSFNNGKLISARSEESGSFTEYIPKPPDGGWGWVIVFASFVGNMIVDSIGSTYGILLPEIQRHYGSSKAAASLVGSLQGACMLTAGPIVSGLVNKFGTRPVSIFGALLAAVATFVSVWATSPVMLVFSYGIITGTGLSMVWLPSVIQVGYYFEKKRAVAVGIACAGSGMGTFILAPLITYLIETVGWQGCLWILSGFILQGVVTGGLLRPLVPKKSAKQLDSKLRGEAVKILESMTEYQPEKSFPLAEEWQKKAHGELEHMTEDRSLAPFFIQLEQQFSEDQKGEHAEIWYDIYEEWKAQHLDESHNGLEISSAAFEKEPAFQPELETIEEYGVLVHPEDGPPDDEAENDPAEKDGEGQEREGAEGAEGSEESPRMERKNDEDDEEEEDSDDDETTSIVNSVGVGTSISSINSVLTDRTEGAGPSMQVRRRWKESKLEAPSRKKLSARYIARSLQRLKGMNPLAAAHSLGTISSVDLEDFSKPMYKKDIFYSGSIQNLSLGNFATEGDYGKFRESTISIPRIKLPAIIRDRKLTPSPVLKGLKPLRSSFSNVLLEMMGFDLLQDRFMQLFCLAGSGTILSYFIPWIYLGSHAREMGFSVEASAFLLSLIGITNAIGRVFFGWLADRNWLQAMHIMNIAVGLSAILTSLVSLYTTYSLLAAYAVLYGFLSASFVTLTTVIVVDYMGLEKLTNSYGLVLLFRGIAAALGSPISAFLYDYSRSYSLSFGCAGATQFIATLLSATIPLFCRRVPKAIPTRFQPMIANVDLIMP